MIRILLLSFILLIFSFQSHAEEKIIWSGEVKSDGTPSHLTTLTVHKTYQIKVNGIVNLGKWIQNKEELANDACFEFNQESFTSKINALRNSNEISVCDGTYHLDHLYQSKPFVAKQDRIFFWVYDTYYDDNSGAFQVQILEVPSDKA